MGVVGGPASTFNPYLYVRGNPVNLTDPSGRIAPLVAAGLYVGAAALIGGLVGGLVGGVGSLIHQLRQNGGDWSCLDVNAIADSALKSAIVGAVGGAAGALASLGFGAAFTGLASFSRFAAFATSPVLGAANVAASSAIGGQLARATAAGMAGQSYAFDGWSTLGDAALGVATFGLFSAGASVIGGARSLGAIADDVAGMFGKAANPLSTRPKEVPSLRQPNLRDGKYGTSSNFDSLDGFTRTEAERFLDSLNPESVKTTPGGYTEYRYSDGSKVWIGPDNKIDRVPWIDPTIGARPKGMRITPSGDLARPHTFTEEQLLP